jgi:hypothetical protein
MPTTDQRQLARILADRIRAHRAAGVDLDAPGGEAALARLLARDVSDLARLRALADPAAAPTPARRRRGSGSPAPTR